MIGFSVALQIELHHVPFAQRVLAIGPLSTADCLLTMGVALLPVVAIELAKLVRRSGRV